MEMPELWRLSSSQDVEKKSKSCKELRLINWQQTAQNLFRFWCTVVLQWYPTQWYGFEQQTFNPSLCRFVCRYREHGYRGGEGADRARSPAPTHHPPQPLFHTSRYDTNTSAANLLLFTHQLSWLVPSLPSSPVPALSLRSDRTLLLTMLLSGRFAQQFRLQCFLNWWPKAANYFQIGPQLGQIFH